MLTGLMKSKSAVILVLNKIDLLQDKSDLISLITELNSKYSFESIIPISVKIMTAFPLWKMRLRSWLESPHFPR